MYTAPEVAPEAVPRSAPLCRFQSIDPSKDHFVDSLLLSLIAKHTPEDLNKIDIPGQDPHAKVFAFRPTNMFARSSLLVQIP